MKGVGKMVPGNAVISTAVGPDVGEGVPNIVKFSVP